MINNWRTSSYTTEGNACVELGYDNTTCGVRDSKNITGPKLVFNGHGPMNVLLTAVKTGHFPAAR